MKRRDRDGNIGTCAQVLPSQMAWQCFRLRTAEANPGAALPPPASTQANKTTCVQAEGPDESVVSLGGGRKGNLPHGHISSNSMLVGCSGVPL